MANRGRPRLYACECDGEPVPCATCAADKAAMRRRDRRRWWAAIQNDPVRLEEHRRQSREAGKRQRKARAEAKAAGELAAAGDGEGVSN